MEILTYPNIEHVLKKELKNPKHLYNIWKNTPFDSKESLLLQKLEAFLETLLELNGQIPKSLKDKLQNSGHSKPTNIKQKTDQFVDTYYELEVGCSLIEQGFDVDFNQKIKRKSGKNKTPDLFLKNEKTIIEVKTFHQSQKIEKGINSNKVFKINELEKVYDKIIEDLNDYSEAEKKYPLIFILCNDYLINPTIISCDDLEAFFDNRPQKMMKIIGNQYEFIKDDNFSGFFHGKNCEAANLSGVGLWRKKLLCFYENPNVNSSSKIPDGKMLEFFKKINFSPLSPSTKFYPT